MLETQDLGFVYDDGTVALEGITLAIEDGEKVALVGPNGAGKSTLLHLVAGFRMPFTGRVTVSGVDLVKSNADALRRDIGLVFQDPDDQIFMPTVEEDVAFGPRNIGLDNVEGRVTHALRCAGIEHLAKRRPHRLSYGMRKRVAVAGTLAMDPKMLLMDEPTSGLDPRARSELIKLLRDMDKTMLIATHDLEAAAEIVDRTIVLNVSPIMEGSMRDIVLARGILDKAGLEIPPVSRLFGILESMGYQVGDMPVSMNQAVKELTKVIERGGRRVHARVNEHDHARGDRSPKSGHIRALVKDLSDDE